MSVIAAHLWRRSLLAAGGEAALAATLHRVQPISLLALLATLVLLVEVPVMLSVVRLVLWSVRASGLIIRTSI